MSSLDARIGELESQQPTSMVTAIVVRRLLADGETHRPLVALAGARTGALWTIGAAEQEAEFVARAAGQARSAGRTIAMLFESEASG